MLVKKGTPFVFTAVLEDGKQDKFIRATLLSSGGVVQSVYNVPHISDGLYSKNDIIATNEGIYLVKYEVFKDAGFISPAKQYSLSLETVRVEAIEESLTETIDYGDGTAN